MGSLRYLFFALLLGNVLFATADEDDDEDEGPTDFVGIDLGTTYSCVGYWKDGQVEIIANDQGNRITPSYVAFDGSDRLVGDAAKNQIASNPENTIFDVKRLIGRLYNDKEVQKDKKMLPFKIVEKNSKPSIQVEQSGKKKVYSPEEISG